MIRASFLAVWTACLVFDAVCLAKGEDKYPRVIVGKVSDSDGKPIEGARVDYGLFSEKADNREFVLTDRNGLYRLLTNKAGRDYRVGVSARGYAPQYLDSVVPGPAGNPSEHSFKLQPGAKLELRLITRAGRPLRNLHVRPTTPSSGFYSSFSSPTPQTPFPGFDRALTTDDDGRVSFDSLPPIKPRTYAKEFPQENRRPTPWLGLQISRPPSDGYQNFSVTAEQAAAAEDGKPVVLTVSDFLAPQPKDGTIKGQVVDKETGNPIREFNVVVRHSPDAHKFLADDGRFELRGEMRRQRVYQTRVFADGYAVAVAHLAANVGDAIQEQRIELQRHPSLIGRLVDNQGKPVAGVQLVTGVAPNKRRPYIEWSSLDRYADGYHSLDNVLRVKTDEDGGFTVPESPGQQTSLLIKAPGYARQVIVPKNRPQADDQGRVVITLLPAARLVAVADRTTQLGKLSDGVALGIRPDNDGFDHMYHSSEFDEKGVRVYESMASGECTVTLYSGNGSTHYPCYSKSVTLTAGEETRVELGAMFGDLTIRGVAPPFATVRINGSGIEQGPSRFAVHADVDGEFELRGLLPGKYALSTDLSSASRGFHRAGGLGITVELAEDTEVDLRTPQLRLQNK